MKFLGTRSALFAALCVVALQAEGDGLGVYVNLAKGGSDIDHLGNDFSVDTKQGAVGFVYDTNVSKRSVFNYRLGVEVGKIVYEHADGEIKLGELAITHDFGFAFVRDKNLRVWVGPELRFSYQKGTDEDGIYWVGAGGAIGPVLGLNWNLKSGTTLFAKAGYLRDDNVLRSDVSPTAYETRGSSYFANLGIMFRFNERK